MVVERSRRLGLEINLVGGPSVDHQVSNGYRPRSRKTWALLCYLLLSERPPSRSRLSALLFAEAADPLGALRWGLSELRRLLGPDAQLGGDPVVLVLPENVVVDVRLISGGNWEDAVALPNLSEELLAGFDDLGSPEFEAWLLAERRHVAAATEDVVHEGTLALLASGDYIHALPLAVSLVRMNPYKESHQALLIRTYVASGDAVAAKRQFEACTKLFAEELGLVPGPAVRAAMQPPVVPEAPAKNVVALDAIIEAGRGALSAGATESGVVSLRSGVALADTLVAPSQRVKARLGLAAGLFSSEHGDDDEGALLLHEAAEIAKESDELDLYGLARVELGYLDMLGARYDRAQQWLDPNQLETEDELVHGRARSFLGCLESDRANYETAATHLGAAIEHSRAAAEPRQEAYAMSLLGRLHFLRGDIDEATAFLKQSLEICRAQKWIGFAPWPQSFLGEIELERGDRESASRDLEQAFARACQMGDPCWEGVSGRALALLAEANGDTNGAFAILEDATQRCNRRSDTYVWAKGYILDAQCTLGLGHDHELANQWIDQLYRLATNTGMRELQTKAMIHRTTAGIENEEQAAINLAEDIANPRLLALAKQR